MSVYNNNLLFSIQNQPFFTISSLLQSLILACGGSINPAYFNFLEMDITECLYHLYLFKDLKDRENNLRKETKVSEWGFEGIEWQDG